MDHCGKHNTSLSRYNSYESVSDRNGCKTERPAKIVQYSAQEPRPCRSSRRRCIDAVICDGGRAVEHICDLDLANITVLYFLSVLSLYHLTAIAWERNVAIRKGLQYQVLVSKSLLVKLSIFAWLVAAFTDLPATILTVTVEDMEIIDMWMTIECTLMVIRVIIIAYYNILVYLGVRKHKKNQIVPLTANQKMESKTAKICGLLTLVIFSSFLPKLLISIFSEIFPAPLQSNSAFRLTETLVQLNSLLTPLIYWYRDRRFRNAVLEILRLRKP